MYFYLKICVKFYKYGANNREISEEFAALGRYAIFRIAQNFDSFFSYDLRCENYDALTDVFDADILKEAENLVKFKQQMTENATNTTTTVKRKR